MSEKTKYSVERDELGRVVIPVGFDVEELRKILVDLPDDAEVCMWDSSYGAAPLTQWWYDPDEKQLQLYPPDDWDDIAFAAMKEETDAAEDTVRPEILAEIGVDRIVPKIPEVPLEWDSYVESI